MTKTQSKAARVRRLLAREKGATLIEIGKATDWKPHSCRAFLTGIRKKGRLAKIERQDGATAYQLAAASDSGDTAPEEVTSEAEAS